MEEFLKFINSKQAVRIEAFMFAWRVLMAIILTNLFMESQGYHIHYNSINFLEGIKFLFSVEFILVCSIYLFFIFIFFWVLIVVCTLFEWKVNKNNVQTNESGFEIIFRFLIKKDEQKTAFLRNEKSLKILTFIEKDSKKRYSSKFLTFFLTRTNVLISTVITFSCSIIMKGAYTGLNLTVLSIIAILLITSLSFLFSTLYIFTLSENLNQWIGTMKNRGFYHLRNNSI